MKGKQRRLGAEYCLTANDKRGTTEKSLSIP